MIDDCSLDPSTMVLEEVTRGLRLMQESDRSASTIPANADELSRKPSLKLFFLLLLLPLLQSSLPLQWRERDSAILWTGWQARRRRMLPLLKKGDLVYLPSDITLIDNHTVKKWIRLEEPTVAVMVEVQVNKEDIYHKVHVKGNDWLVRTIDTMEVLSRA